MELSRNMLNDITTKGKTQEKYADKPFIIFKFDIFEKMSDYFDEDDTPTEIELKNNFISNIKN